MSTDDPARRSWPAASRIVRCHRVSRQSRVDERRGRLELQVARGPVDEPGVVAPIAGARGLPIQRIGAIGVVIVIPRPERDTGAGVEIDGTPYVVAEDVVEHVQCEMATTRERVPLLDGVARRAVDGIAHDVHIGVNGPAGRMAMPDAAPQSQLATSQMTLLSISVLTSPPPSKVRRMPSPALDRGGS